MVDSIGATSGSSVQSSSAVSTNKLDEDEEKKKKAEENGELFTFDNKNEESAGTQINEDTAKSTAQSYIAALKAQYPQLASKLDSYYSNLDISTLCASASSTSDIKAYIFSETQGFLQ